VRPERRTLDEAVALFLASRRALSHDVRVSTARVVRLLVEAVRQRLVRAGHDRVSYPADISPADLDHVLNEIASKRPGTAVIKAVGSLRQLGRFLLVCGDVLLDPCKDLVCKKHVPKLGFVPSREDMARLFSAADPESVLLRADLVRPPARARARRWWKYQRRLELERAEAERDVALLDVLYGSALRFQEAVLLSITDLNLADRALFIERGKGGKSRVVPVTLRAKASLVTYMAEGRRVLLASRMRRPSALSRPPSHALFLSTTGRPLDPQCWRERRFAPLLAASRLPASLGPHGLRHACAVHLLESGADVLLITRLLGHARLSTTAIYLKLSTTELERTLLSAHPREKA
jgi:site-specific recombinase XerD